MPESKQRIALDQGENDTLFRGAREIQRSVTWAVTGRAIPGVLHVHGRSLPLSRSFPNLTWMLSALLMEMTLKRKGRSPLCARSPNASGSEARWSYVGATANKENLRGSAGRDEG